MLNTEIQIENGICTIVLNGSVSMKNALSLKELIIVKANEGLKEIILDFGNNVYLDSSGIGAIFNAQKYLNEKGAVLKIKNVSSDVLTILRIANLDKHLHIIK